MAEHYPKEVGYHLTVEVNYHKSHCYKFYWLEAIARLIFEDIHETTFDAVINAMIRNS